MHSPMSEIKPYQSQSLSGYGSEKVLYLVKLADQKSVLVKFPVALIGASIQALLVVAALIETVASHALAISVKIATLMIPAFSSKGLDEKIIVPLFNYAKHSSEAIFKTLWRSLSQDAESITFDKFYNSAFLKKLYHIHIMGDSRPPIEIEVPNIENRPEKPTPSIIPPKKKPPTSYKESVSGLLGFSFFASAYGYLTRKAAVNIAQIKPTTYMPLFNKTTRSLNKVIANQMSQIPRMINDKPFNTLPELSPLSMIKNSFFPRIKKAIAPLRLLNNKPVWAAKTRINNLTCSVTDKFTLPFSYARPETIFPQKLSTFWKTAFPAINNATCSFSDKPLLIKQSYNYWIMAGIVAIPIILYLGKKLLSSKLSKQVQKLPSLENTSKNVQEEQLQNSNVPTSSTPPVTSSKTNKSPDIKKNVQKQSSSPSYATKTSKLTRIAQLKETSNIGQFPSKSLKSQNVRSSTNNFVSSVPKSEKLTTAKQSEENKTQIIQESIKENMQGQLPIPNVQTPPPLSVTSSKPDRHLITHESIKESPKHCTPKKMNSLQLEKKCEKIKNGIIQFIFKKQTEMLEKELGNEYSTQHFIDHRILYILITDDRNASRFKSALLALCQIDEESLKEKVNFVENNRFRISHADALGRLLRHLRLEFRNLDKALLDLNKASKKQTHSLKFFLTPVVTPLKKAQPGATPKTAFIIRKNVPTVKRKRKFSVFSAKKFNTHLSTRDRIPSDDDVKKTLVFNDVSNASPTKSNVS